MARTLNGTVRSKRRVTEFGGRIRREKMSSGEYDFMALVIDTGGKLFGPHSMQ